ncbi:oligosaccharide flippase family protein [Riemerella anatipestifer]|uniref:oligosaccharide flippase family protein n=1 Tax=Riemerella anatipestifer TaxID=34085 RepID=UPI00069B8752|nr:oligosaccharide flippase family protein [Riemerella anatipestifer]MDY3351692.1 oligosaccharide flippase family protein [Riemerella anatipestifer]MSN86234.1 flippase [Riemerella anatipestifer]WFS33543.1 oligosaccharide flippase family protein [Riemerella anatipestifer]
MKRIRNILKNKDYKALIENIVSLGVLQFVNLVLPLLVLPYMLRTVGFEKYGIIVVAASLVMYFQSLTDYSFAITATRDVAVFRDSKKKLDLIFSKVMSIKFFFLFLSLIIIAIFSFLVPKFFEYRYIIYFSMLMLVGNVLFPDWYFQGIEKMKYITMINAFVKVLFTVLVFVFIKNENDYWIYPLLQSLGYIIAGLVGLFIVIRKHNIKFYVIGWRRVRRTIQVNFPVFINQFMPVLYNNTSSFLLGMMVSNSAAGLFDSLKKVVDMAIMLIGVISRAFFPFLNRQKHFFLKYRKMMLSLGVLMVILILLFSKLIFRCLSITYVNSFWILLTLSLGIIGIAMYNIYGTNYLIIKRKDKLVMKNTFLVSVVGFVLSFPLIYSFEIMGGALSLSFSRFFLGVGVVYLYHKLKKKNCKI